MKPEQRRFLALAIFTLLLWCAFMAVNKVHAQADPVFAKPGKVLWLLSNRPSYVMNRMVATFNQAQISAFEAAITPPPTNHEKRSALGVAYSRLNFIGEAEAANDLKPKLVIVLTALRDAATAAGQLTDAADFQAELDALNGS